MHVSPDGRGLTGLESWFWVSGYSGPVRDVVDELGLRVEVEAVPAAVRWDFGDGSPVQPGTLGSAAPTRSDVVHTYERRSRATPMGIRASVRLDVRYRVDGEPWQALDPVFRTATPRLSRRRIARRCSPRTEAPARRGPEDRGVA